MPLSISALRFGVRRSDMWGRLLESMDHSPISVPQLRDRDSGIHYQIGGSRYDSSNFTLRTTDAAGRERVFHGDPILNEDGHPIHHKSRSLGIDEPDADFPQLEFVA